MLPEEIEGASESDIRRWLEGVGSIFVTGATGFVGMVLLEKLLRGAPGLSRVYVLIRDKRQQSAEERLKQLLKDPIFQKVPPSQFEKITVVKGDVSLPSLGLDEETWNSLHKDISVVFHVAATVKFDEPIRQAVNTNVRGTREVLHLCRDAPRLKVVIYVSTAFSNSHLRYIDESIYTSPCSAEGIITMVNDYDIDTLTRITPQLIGDWPNTYTYTKALTEGLVAESAAHMPLVIVRPAVVTSTADEPIKGWTNNINGVMGIVVGSGVGLLRTLHTPPLQKSMDSVPCDKVVNLILACAWDLDKRRSKGDNKLKIFNYASSKRNPFTWKLAYEATLKYGAYFVSMRALWIAATLLTTNLLVFTIMDFLLHVVPAILIDSISVVKGDKPRMLDITRKIQKRMKANSFFAITYWTFVENNADDLWSNMSQTDRRCFNFNLGDMDWDKYMLPLIIGLRQYILKEPSETAPAAIVRMRRMFWANAALFTVMWLLLLFVLGRYFSTLMYFAFPAAVVVSCILVFGTVLWATVPHPMYLWPPLLVNNFYDKQFYASIKM